jgi:hypothetical protein
MDSIVEMHPSTAMWWGNAHPDGDRWDRVVLVDDAPPVDWEWEEWTAEHTAAKRPAARTKH